jgi:hypothetical protein
MGHSFAISEAHRVFFSKGYHPDFADLLLLNRLVYF